MEENFEVAYDERVITDDSKKISKKDLLKIKDIIEEKLTTYPNIFGKPLRTPLSGFWSMRFGSFRIIYQIEKQLVTIRLIEKRETTYKTANKRLL